MEYTYELSGQQVSAHYNDILTDEAKGCYGVMSFWLENPSSKRHPRKEYMRTVRKDGDGKLFFTWDKKKVMFDSYKAYTPEELVDRFKNDRVWGTVLCNTLQKYGLDSLIVSIKTKELCRVNIGGFCMAFKVESNIEDRSQWQWVDYKFVPEYLCMPEDGYKLRLIPAKDEDVEVYPSERFYVDDLCGLIAKRTDMYRIRVAEKEDK